MKKYGEDLEVRDYFEKDEIIDTYENELNDNIPEEVEYEKVFVCGSFGIILQRFFKFSNSVYFNTIVKKNDDKWHLITCEKIPSSFLGCYIKALNAAVDWCENNCEKYIEDDMQYGYAFKD
jgi:hypothetical protein